jgi:hypothetical protein
MQVSQSLTATPIASTNPGGSRDQTRLSGVFEAGAYAHWWVCDCVGLRAGYNVIWAVNVPEASQNVNFNPNVAGGSPDNHGSILFHGPVFELFFKF